MILMFNKNVNASYLKSDLPLVGRGAWVNHSFVIFETWASFGCHVEQSWTVVFAHELTLLLPSFQRCGSQLVPLGCECMSGHNIKHINKNLWS
jgi:hypothetical protein